MKDINKKIKFLLIIAVSIFSLYIIGSCMIIYTESNFLHKIGEFLIYLAFMSPAIPFLFIGFKTIQILLERLIKRQ